MKTVTVFFAIAMLALTLTGCGKSDNATPTETSPQSEQQQEKPADHTSTPALEKAPPPKMRPQTKDNF